MYRDPDDLSWFWLIIGIFAMLTLTIVALAFTGDL